MLNPTLEAEKQLLKSQIKNYAPFLYKFFEVKLSLKEYARVFYDFKPLPIHEGRQQLIKNSIKKKLALLFGNNYEANLKINLNGPLVTNIADHHQVLNHPILISSNVISSANKILTDTKQDAILVLSSDDVPTNNFFSHFGFQFHDKRLPIFSNSEKASIFYCLPKRDFDFVERAKKADRWKEFDTAEKDFLVKERDWIKNLDFSRCLDYSDQITLINQAQWPRLFEEKMRPNLPELVYLTQEEIVSDCLIDILKEDDNIVSRSLFDVDFRQAVLNNFRGIVTAWKETENKGTHFFWRKNPDRPESLHLYIEGEYLVPTDPNYASYKIKLDKESIVAALEKREIFPNLFMIFTVLNFWAGVRPLTGYGSIIYLTLMKDVWIKTLIEVGDNTEAENVKDVMLDNLIAGLAVFFKRTSDGLKPLYAYDAYYEGGLTREYLEKALEMPVSDLLILSIPDVYQYIANKYIPAEEKIVNMKLAFKDLAEEVFGWVK